MNRSQLNWYVGKIVYDPVYCKTGLVVRTPASCSLADEPEATWDFDVLYEGGELFAADLDELEVVNAETQEG